VYIYRQYLSLFIIMKKIPALLFSCLLLVPAAYAQKKKPVYKKPPAAVAVPVMPAAPARPEPFVLGQIDHLHSNILGEDRVLNVYLPDEYKANPTNSFPVIYLLDGAASEDFIHMTGLVRFLNTIGVLKPSIVVGIANIDRKRDMTFPTRNKEDKQTWPTTGGSANFISFIEKELQPYVEKNYRTTSSKTIVGQSLGGLLATEVLLKKTHLFSQYIIISPSLWWDDESLLAQAGTLLKQQPDYPIAVYISVGSEGKQMETDAAQLANVLRLQSKARLRTIFVPMPEENHATILHRSAYKAFEMLNPKP